MTFVPAVNTLERERHLLFISHAEWWPHRPYLPLIRRRPGYADEYGLLYDTAAPSGHTTRSVTVYFCNLFLLPPTEAELLALPTEVFASTEELYAAGWRVD